MIGTCLMPVAGLYQRNRVCIKYANVEMKDSVGGNYSVNTIFISQTVTQMIS